jgi:RNA polymerase sigma-70 factor (ECF subfamily)
MSDQTPPQGSSRSASAPAASSDGTGVAAVLVQLVAEHHAAVYRYAFRLCGSAADAEDITQQTFLIAQQKLDQVRESDRAGHWLLVVARNAFLKSCRRRIPMPAGGLEIDINSVPDRSTADPLEVGGPGSETGIEPISPEQLQAAIDELPDEFRVPLLMFYFEDSSYRDIAEQLDLPPGTVMSRLSRAKSHLRRKLLVGESTKPRSEPHRNEPHRNEPHRHNLKPTK